MKQSVVLVSISDYRCWSGNILGVGAVRQFGPEAGDHFGCWCCRPPVVGNSDGHYVIQLRKEVSN